MKLNPMYAWVGKIHGTYVEFGMLCSFRHHWMTRILYSSLLITTYLKNMDGNSNPSVLALVSRNFRKQRKLWISIPARWERQPTDRVLPNSLGLSMFTRSHRNYLQNVGYSAHACNPSTQETEAGGSTVGGQPELHCKSLSQTDQKKKKCK
jgi:hypothetical protein